MNSNTSNSNSSDSIEVHFHLYNIVATRSKPFRIIAKNNDERTVLFESHMDMTGVTVQCQLNEESVQLSSSFQFLNLNIQIPILESRLETFSLKVNLTSNGRHILVAPELPSTTATETPSKTRKIKIIQQSKPVFDSFPTPEKFISTDAEKAVYRIEESLTIDLPQVSSPQQQQKLQLHQQQNSSLQNSNAQNGNKLSNLLAQKANTNNSTSNKNVNNNNSSSSSSASSAFFNRLTSSSIARRNVPKLATEAQRTNIEHLRSLMESGVLTEQEFNDKKLKVLGENCVLQYDESHMNEDERRQLEKLDQFRQQGILTSEEFQREKQKILDRIGRIMKYSAIPKTPSKVSGGGQGSTGRKFTPISPTAEKLRNRSLHQTPSQEQNVDLSLLNASQMAQLKKMSQFVTKGIMTQVDYDRKLVKMVEEAKAARKTNVVTKQISIPIRVGGSSANNTPTPEKDENKKVSSPVQSSQQQKVAAQVVESGGPKSTKKNEEQISSPKDKEHTSSTATTTAAPAAATVVVKTPTFDESDLVGLSALGKAEARRLQNLVLKHDLSMTDYELRLKKLKDHEARVQQQQALQQAQAQQAAQNFDSVIANFSDKQKEMLSTMRELISRGLVTMQEYEAKVKQIQEQNRSEMVKLQMAKAFQQQLQRKALEEQQRKLEAERLEAERLRIEQEKEAERIRKQQELEMEQARLKKEELERKEREYLEEQRLKREEEIKKKAEEARLREEQARIERERLEQEKLQEQERQRLLEELARKEQEEQLERERLLAEELERQRLESERRMAELIQEKERRIREEKERMEQVRLENERIEKERLENERLEEERRLELERLKQEQEQLAAAEQEQAKTIDSTENAAQEEESEESEADRERKRRERILRGELVSPKEEEVVESVEYIEEEEEEEVYEYGDDVEYGDGYEEEEVEFNDPILDEVEMDEEQWDKIVTLINFVKQGFMTLEEYEESRNEILGIEVAYEEGEE